jgi:hypothetical protein
MISIRAIYKIPEARHVFFIVEPLDSSCDYLQGSQARKRRREYFEHILRSKGRSSPKVTQPWTLRIMPADDFLSAIEQNTPRELVSSNQSSQNPEKLELLAINLTKTLPNSSDWTLQTPKALCAIPDEDIIEVFI